MPLTKNKQELIVARPLSNNYFAADIRGARLSTYPGVGHLPIIEEAERFNREVIEFLG